MSGHSKWHKVKNEKALKDPKKSKNFTRLSKQIQIAARQGGPDPSSNPTLRKAMEDAKASNLPKENIQRAINKGAGIGDEGRLESVSLEGYGPGGVAIMVSGETDNRNRTIAEVRALFKEYGGSLGEPGSAAYVFGADPHNPTFKTPVEDEHSLGQLASLIEELENHDDVMTVFHNLQEEE
ncbi:YebC/PmpR family DNA-binding transcriptional regulator [candidate division WWE3 bacterium]|nr:YebC/PmpR family DNA-binding transcriptional regulator [candidate division WWE3 bacterium]